MKLIILFIIFTSYYSNVASLQCLWNNTRNYVYFASKTPYENIRGDIRDYITKQKDCEAISIWAYIRHGKRHPGPEFGENAQNVVAIKQRILSYHEAGNISLCIQDIENFRNWILDEAMVSEPNKLTRSGYMELVGIAKRLKEAFPELLNNLQSEDYRFHPVYGQRMVDSGHGFIEGLGNKHLLLLDPIYGYDEMAPYMTCGKYQKDVKLNQHTNDEVHKYLTTPEFLRIKEAISRRLDFPTLTSYDIVDMYDVCRFSWEVGAAKQNPWCDIFSDEDLIELEYLGDIEHYYRNGYGTQHGTAVFGQINLANLLKSFEQVKNGTGKKIVANFGHATMLDMIAVGLSLFKDDNPITGNYRDPNRAWRATVLSPFAGNIMAVLNRCTKPDSKEGIYDHNVAFYWNEKPLLEMCHDGVCSWQEFEAKFKPFLKATAADFCEFEYHPY